MITIGDSPTAERNEFSRSLASEEVGNANVAVQGRYQVLLSESDNPVVTIGSYQVMLHYRIVTTGYLNSKSQDSVLRHMQTARFIIRIVSVGNNSLFFPQREGRREGEGVKVTQVPKLSKSHYHLTW